MHRSCRCGDLCVFLNPFVLEFCSAAEPSGPAFAECRVSDGQDCSLEYLRSELPEEQDGWVIYPEGAPACSSGSEYSFQVIY